jgi:hypothetical protein
LAVNHLLITGMILRINLIDSEMCMQQYGDQCGTKQEELPFTSGCEVCTTKNLRKSVYERHKCNINEQ